MPLAEEPERLGRKVGAPLRAADDDRDVHEMRRHPTPDVVRQERVTEGGDRVSSLAIRQQFDLGREGRRPVRGNDLEPEAAERPSQRGRPAAGQDDGLSAGSCERRRGVER